MKKSIRLSLSMILSTGLLNACQTGLTPNTILNPTQASNALRQIPDLKDTAQKQVLTFTEQSFLENLLLSEYNKEAYIQDALQLAGESQDSFSIQQDYSSCYLASDKSEQARNQTDLDSLHQKTFHQDVASQFGSVLKSILPEVSKTDTLNFFEDDRAAKMAAYAQAEIENKEANFARYLAGIKAELQAKTIIENSQMAQIQLKQLSVRQSKMHESQGTDQSIFRTHAYEFENPNNGAKHEVIVSKRYMAETEKAFTYELKDIVVSSYNLRPEQVEGPENSIKTLRLIQFHENGSRSIATRSAISWGDIWRPLTPDIIEDAIDDLNGVFSKFTTQAVADQANQDKGTLNTMSYSLVFADATGKATGAGQIQVYVNGEDVRQYKSFMGKAEGQLTLSAKNEKQDLDVSLDENAGQLNLFSTKAEVQNQWQLQRIFSENSDTAENCDAKLRNDIFVPGRIYSFQAIDSSFTTCGCTHL